MAQSFRRTPKNYQGTNLTGHNVSELLPHFLDKLGKVYSEKPDLILETWPEIIGPQFAKRTKALSFFEGILTVNVSDSTLNSLLYHEKARLLDSLRKRFPKVLIKNILFRIG